LGNIRSDATVAPNASHMVFLNAFFRDDVSTRTCTVLTDTVTLLST
jgi:hypothetical protein